VLNNNFDNRTITVFQQIVLIINMKSIIIQKSTLPLHQSTA